MANFVRFSVDQLQSMEHFFTSTVSAEVYSHFDPFQFYIEFFLLSFILTAITSKLFSFPLSAPCRVVKVT